MLSSAILLFGAIACASASSSGSGSGISSSVVDEKHDVFNELDKKFFEPSWKKKGIIHRYDPFYYVSYDLYENTCTNERCNDVADLFLTSMKKTAKPCDDFYEHACGKKQNKMRSLMQDIKEILEQQSIEQQPVRSLLLEKKFYRSCMEQRGYDYKTRREFSKLLELSNGISLFRPQRGFGVIDWQSIDGFYASLGFEHAFFNIHVTREPEQADVNLIALTPPSPQYFYSLHGLLKHKNFTDIILNLLGDYDQSNPYVVEYDDVIEFNNELHMILPPLGLFEEKSITNKMTLEEWQNIYNSTLENENYDNNDNNNHINWYRLLNTLLKSANLHIKKSDEIVLKKMDYFTKLTQLLENTSPVTIEKYIHFKFLSQIGKYLNPNLARFFENDPDRSTFCIRQFDNQLIGATYEYIKRHVPHEQKVYAEKVVDDVRNALIILISNAAWMDEETKTYAILKLKKLHVMVGYPDWQVNKTFVNNYYGNLRFQSNFFENMIKYKRRSLINELRGLKYPQLYDPLTMSKKHTPLIYNFEVNSYMNRIFLPTEYLNEKKYKVLSPKLPSAVNYGSFGSMLGSIFYDYVSLTDNLKFNGVYTRSAEGLSKDTMEAYKIKEKCLTNQLSDYKKTASEFDEPLASVIDLDTIQVDKIYEKITGVRAAFEAYRKIRSENEVLLPGFENMSSYQLFFLAYAERICEIGDIYDKYDAYETSLKVNGVLSNLQQFSNVFHCSKRSEMNRKTKCELFT